MSRSWRSPRTRTRVHQDKRKELLEKIQEQEVEEEVGASCASGSVPQAAMMGADSTQELANAALSERCSNCVFVTTGTRCPECGEISAPNYSLEAVRTAERLYGTAYGSGRYNEGLGERTYGKSDFNRRVKAAGLRQREPGEVRDMNDTRRRAAAESRKRIHHEVSETVRHFDI